MLMKVVLPAPFGPMTERISPRASEKSMSALATRPWKRLPSPSTSSSALTAPHSCGP